MRGKINVAGGSVGKLNVYTQITEPTKKEGIWIQCEGKCEGVEISKGNHKGFYLLKNAPEDILNMNRNYTAVIGKDIYIFAGYYFYKYDTLINKYIELENTENITIDGGRIVGVGTTIYLLGVHGNHTSSYKYDTLTDTIENIKAVPFDFQLGDAVAIGINIYLFNGTNCYEYNTLTDTYMKKRDIPVTFRNERAVSVGTDVYLLSGYTTTKYNYTYDTIKNTYIKKKNIPYAFKDGRCYCY